MNLSCSLVAAADALGTPTMKPMDEEGVGWEVRRHRDDAKVALGGA